MYIHLLVYIMHVYYVYTYTVCRYTRAYIPHMFAHPHRYEQVQPCHPLLNRFQGLPISSR